MFFNNNVSTTDYATLDTLCKFFSVTAMKCFVINCDHKRTKLSLKIFEDLFY